MALSHRLTQAGTLGSGSPRPSSNPQQIIIITRRFSTRPSVRASSSAGDTSMAPPRPAFASKQLATLLRAGAAFGTSAVALAWAANSPPAALLSAGSSVTDLLVHAVKTSVPILLTVVQMVGIMGVHRYVCMCRMLLVLTSRG